MSLDVFVMPMWRFKAGDAETASEQLFGRASTIVTPDGIFGFGRIRNGIARRAAKRKVRQIVKEVEVQLNTRLEWQDEGDVAHSQQASSGFEALRAFAKWLDLTDELSTFVDPPENDYYKHPALLWNREHRPFRFSHIIDHSCHSGYYVPCRFERIVCVESFQTYGNFTFHHSFGSSYRLAEELQTLHPHIPAADDASVSVTSRELIAAGFDTLVEVSTKSLKHGLPIIFWG